jgi:hypothetical protein
MQATPIREVLELCEIDVEIPKQDCARFLQQRKNIVSREVGGSGAMTIYDAPEIFEPDFL